MAKPASVLDRYPDYEVNIGMEVHVKLLENLMYKLKNFFFFLIFCCSPIIAMDQDAEKKQQLEASTQSNTDQSNAGNISNNKPKKLETELVSGLWPKKRFQMPKGTFQKLRTSDPETGQYFETEIIYPDGKSPRVSLACSQEFANLDPVLSALISQHVLNQHHFYQGYIQELAKRAKVTEISDPLYPSNYEHDNQCPNYVCQGFKSGKIKDLTDKKDRRDS
jgi:hypothetical protein